MKEGDDGKEFREEVGKGGKVRGKESGLEED